MAVEIVAGAKREVARGEVDTPLAELGGWPGARYESIFALDESRERRKERHAVARPIDGRRLELAGSGDA